MYSFRYELFLAPDSDSTNTKTDPKEHIEPSTAPLASFTASIKGEELCNCKYLHKNKLFLGPDSGSKIDSKEHIEPSRAPSFTAASDKGEELFLKWQFFQVTHQKRRNIIKIGGPQRSCPILIQRTLYKHFPRLGGPRTPLPTPSPWFLLQCTCTFIDQHLFYE